MSNGNYTQLTTANPYGESDAAAINDLGQIITDVYIQFTTNYSNLPKGYYSFLGSTAIVSPPGVSIYVEGAYQTIPAPYFYGINNAGQIVGDFFFGRVQHGLVYSNGTYTVVDDPLATNETYLQGINNLGQIVGIYYSANLPHSFLYDNGVFTSIDNPLATGGTTVSGINDEGQFVGSYSDATGEHGFLATPASASPEPTTMLLAGAAIAGFALIRTLRNRLLVAR